MATSGDVRRSGLEADRSYLIAAAGLGPTRAGAGVASGRSAITLQL